MGGVKGKRGERTVLSPPAGIGVKMQRAATNQAEAERAKLDTAEFAVRLLVIGTQEVLRCPSCVACVPCKRHGADAYKAALVELGLADVPNIEPVDPNRENIALSDLWIANWLKFYGTEEERRAGKLAKRILDVRHFRAIAEKRKEYGFELLRDAINGVFASEFHTTKSRPNISAVLRDPATFAAYLQKSKRGGTLQGGADTWGGG